MTLDVVFNVFFGLQYSSRAHQLKTTQAFSPHRGAFGTARAAFAVTETQTRGSLHLHAMLWTDVCPRVLERIAGHPYLEKAFIEVLNTQFLNALPVNVHVDDMVARARHSVHADRAWRGELEEGMLLDMSGTEHALETLSSHFSLNACARNTCAPPLLTYKRLIMITASIMYGHARSR
jgi:hypothetical protein